MRAYLARTGSDLAGNSGPRNVSWSPSGGVQNLSLPAASLIDGVSGDGSTVVGDSDPGGAFRWSSAGGYQTLGGVGGRFLYLQGERRPLMWSNMDGSSVIATHPQIFPGINHGPYRWTQTTGWQALLGVPTNQRTTTQGVSADGSTEVGQWANDAGQTGNFIFRDGQGYTTDFSHDWYGANDTGSILTGMDYATSAPVLSTPGGNQVRPMLSVFFVWHRIRHELQRLGRRGLDPRIPADT